MQVLTVISAYFFMYLVVNLILELYGETIKRKGKHLLIAVLTLYYSATVFGYSAATGRTEISDLALVILTLPSPLLILIAYLIGRKLLKISLFKSVGVVRLSLYYAMGIDSFNFLLRKMIFVKGDPYNYLADALGLLLFALIHLAVNHIIRYLIRKSKIISSFPDQIAMQRPMKELANSFLVVSAVFLCTILFLVYPKYNITGNIAAIGFCVICIFIDYNISFYRSATAALENKNIYIQSLGDSVNKLRQAQSEYDGILSSYGELLEQGDLTELTTYHENLVGKTALTGVALHLMQKMQQNPTLVSLLLQKMDYAEKMGTLMKIQEPCNIGELYISDMDLSRVIGNLLDNAIEAAASSDKKYVDLAIENKGEYGKLVIISNSTQCDVDISYVQKSGVSFKQGHCGLGFIQIRNALRKYGNCSIRYAYCDYVFTAYLELGPSPARV